MAKRKQIVIMYKNRHESPYYMDIRVLTLNDNFEAKDLRFLAINEAKKLERKYDLDKFTKIIAPENDKPIDKTEERGLSNNFVYIQVMRKDQIIEFRKVPIGRLN